MSHPTAADAPAPADRSAVVELRQYTLRPGRRDELVELFDREFVEPQEAAGAAVLGQFRDIDAPDRFVWLRGFRDMEARRRALTAFYDGPVWAEHRAQANATMVDSDDVLLLRPLSPASGFAAHHPAPRPRTGAPDPDRLLAASVWSFPPGRSDGAELLREGLLPVLRATGHAPLAVLTTEPAPNTFPRLPVRTGENVVAVFTSYPHENARRQHLTAVQAHPLARGEILPGLERQQTAAPRILRLRPTERSLVR